jgi:hypothetical protein
MFIRSRARFAANGRCRAWGAPPAPALKLRARTRLVSMFDRSPGPRDSRKMARLCKNNNDIGVLMFLARFLLCTGCRYGAGLRHSAVSLVVCRRGERMTDRFFIFTANLDPNRGKPLFRHPGPWGNTPAVIPLGGGARISVNKAGRRDVPRACSAAGNSGRRTGNGERRST